MKITIPDIGDFEAVEIIEILVASGDEVRAEQPMIVLESDKATMEVPAPAAGLIKALSVSVGDKVRQGDVIGELEPEATEAENQAAEPASSADKKADQPAVQALQNNAKITAPKEPIAPITASRQSDIPHASPSVRQFARELGVDLTAVTASGPKGRILKEDVQSHVKSVMQGSGSDTATGIPQLPSIDFSQFGEIEIKELPRIRKISAKNLHRNWLVVPHVTQFEKADITELEAFRRAENERSEIKLTLLPFVIKAVAIALKQYPEFNSSLSPDGASLIMKKYCHIGFAADTPQGLVVPVIRDVQTKGITDLAFEAGELAKKARDGKLSPADMQGGCFSISSLGGIGGTHFTPIVNAPEVAILGVSKADIEPVWDGQSFQPRTRLTLSLSYDHRVIDGALAARMAVRLAELLSDIRRLCL